MNIFALTPLSEVPRLGSVFQALYDLVPIALFVLGSILLLRRLYNKMVKGNYALLAGGSVMVAAAGVMKALHKFLLGVAEIDYVILDKQFSPTQSIGFLLLFIGLVGMFTKYNKNYTKVRACALPLLLPLLAATVYESSLPFIIIMVVGATGTLVTLIYMGVRLKSKWAIVCFAVSMLAMFGMGYLSTQRYYEIAWVSISVNVLCQGAFFLGVVLLDKKGLGSEDAFYREK